MKTISISSLITFLALAAAPLCYAQKSEPIKLKVDRPSKKGDRYETRITSKAAKLQDVIVGGNSVQKEDEKFQGTLEGLVEVQEVNDKGNPSKLKVTVSSLAMRKGTEEKDKQILPAGKVLIAEKKETGKSFTVDGEEADAASKKLLDDMFQLGSEEKMGDEEAMFGLDKPRAPGSSWDLDLKAISEKLGEKMPFEISEKDSSGKMKFTEISKVNGVDCAVVEGVIKLKIVGMKGLQGAKISKANMNITMSGEFPVDPALLIPHRKMELDMVFEGNLPSPTGAADLKMSIQNFKEETNKPAKK